MAPRDVITPDGPADEVDPAGDTVASDEQAPSAFDSLLRQLARTPGPDEAAEAIDLLPGVLVADRFEVEAEIGRGGFARVYRARDRVLSRLVAIKLLARGLRLRDRDLELFYREARATARLNHVHIVTAFDWGVWNGAPFLVLELLEGETLATVLTRGPLPEARAFGIARDITGALVYAHAQGVLHLDLKAQNVYVLRDGRIKVLDFGLAGLDWQDDVPGAIHRVAGGTPATMAPEQERGGPTDARTDVWAVGVIVHLMLLGRLPDRTAATTLLPPGLSRRAETVLRRTLALDPDDRCPDATALLAALEPEDGPPRRPVALSPEQHRQLSFGGDVFDGAISPDGEWLAWVANGRKELWVGRIDDDAPRRLFVDEELLPPAWLPDGRRLLVTRALPRPGAHWVVPTDGGPPRQVPFRNELAIVLAGETIAACPHGFVGPPRVLLAPLDGGEETPLALPEDAKVVIDLDAAADGRLLVTAFESGCRLWCVRKDAPAEELHREAAWIGGARWDREGRGVFFVTGERGRRSLRWRPVPAESGEAATLIEGIPLGEKLSVSRDGRRVIYHRENAYTNLVRVDPARGGATSQVTQGTAEIGRAVVSPDGDSLVYATREGPSHAIVVAALRPGAPRTRIARTHRPCAAPAWSPDGGRIAFRREEGSAWHIVTVSAQGDDERVWSQTRPSAGVGEWIGEWVYLDWLSPTRIVYTSENNGPLRVVDLESGVDRDFLSEPATGWMFSIRVSPDRRRVAFYWNRGAGPTRGIYFADADGGNTRMVLPGRAMVVGWADGGASLVVARIATLGGEVSTSEAFAACLERVELGAGATTTLWTPPDGFNVVDVSLMPRTGELLVVRGEAMSDAWLLEDPLGRPA